MKILMALAMLSVSCCYAAAETYTQYEDNSRGVSFEYPSWAKVEDVSSDGKTKIWFHVGEWPKGLEYEGEQRPQSPASGVSFSVKSEGDFEEFLERERAGQIKGGYRNEITEKEYSIGSGVVGVEFVRNAKQIKEVMYYFVCPSLKENVVLNFWHLKDADTGFMGYPEAEDKAVAEYRRMIKTLRVFR
ncbi:hypothetical protein [Thiohalomonas denitrificans]|uniref:Uncharacterized protein n=1 Tax=Thiohalomonas denitrificans TaxID=415747 RepID=A0A1G5Q779_9GAMM|nr:hypothetical protein [Thiohalomonas denitrificans]SCZ57478.1 hypothetical protein SAMN03097708_01436 [Thiohalomonas denitrificans]